MRLGHGHLSGRCTTSSRRPCPRPCRSLRAGPLLNPSSSRIPPDHRRGRKLSGLPIKKKNPRLRCHPRSSPKCLRYLDRGNRQPSTVVTERSAPGEHIWRRGPHDRPLYEPGLSPEKIVIVEAATIDATAAGDQHPQRRRHIRRQAGERADDEARMATSASGARTMRKTQSTSG
jgi:hypothetical protein